MNIDLIKEVEKGQQDWAFTIGVQAYIWGYPIVECWKDRLKKSWTSVNLENGSSEMVSNVNNFRHVRDLSSYDSSEFVNSASDFLYSTAVIDLSDGPLILNAPNFDSRWYGIQVLDAYMETLANFGTRTVGSEMTPVILCNQSQRKKLSKDDLVVVSEINYLYIVVRVCAGPEENLTDIHDLQNKITLSELNRSSNGEPTYNVGSHDLTLKPLVSASSDCPDALSFFEELASVIKFVPPKLDEGLLLGIFQEIGISLEKGFDYHSLPRGVKAGLAQAVPFAESILERKIFEVGQNINGWGFVQNIGNYDKNYIIRALVAKHGIWANVAEESVYYIARTDSDGNVLHGNNDYEITFHDGNLPPVNAFWSISYYDENGNIVKESNGKSAINSLYNNLYVNDDGSIKIIIAKKAPENHMKNNWLPSHAGMFNLNFRCYNPQQAILEQDYSVPFIQNTRSLSETLSLSTMSSSYA